MYKVTEGLTPHNASLYIWVDRAETALDDVMDQSDVGNVWIHQLSEMKKSRVL